MVTAKKPPAAPRGRPTIPDSERLVQLTIRVPPAVYDLLVKLGRGKPGTAARDIIERALRVAR